MRRVHKLLVTGHPGAERSQVVKHAGHLGHGGGGELDVGPQLALSVTVFRHVHDDRLLPAKEEVPAGGTRHHGKAQPRVIRHEHKHEQV